MFNFSVKERTNGVWDENWLESFIDTSNTVVECWDSIDADAKRIDWWLDSNINTDVVLVKCDETNEIREYTRPSKHYVCSLNVVIWADNELDVYAKWNQAQVVVGNRENVSLGDLVIDECVEQ